MNLLTETIIILTSYAAIYCYLLLLSIQPTKIQRQSAKKCSKEAEHGAAEAESREIVEV